MSLNAPIPAVDAEIASGPSRRWPRRILIAATGAAILAALLFVLLTDGAPQLPRPAPPTPEQVAAARAVAAQLADSRRDRAGTSVLRFGPVQMQAVGALLSNGFQPDRFAMTARSDRIDMVASHRLPFGRWLNAGVVVRGTSRGFPPARLTVGGLALNPGISGAAVRLARVVLNLRGAHIPPLDAIFVNTSVSNGTLTARLRLPRQGRLIQQLTGATSETRVATLASYCTLAHYQTARPATDFIVHLHRAFDPRRAGAGSVDANRATLLALAMLVVDPKVGELAGLRAADIARCRIPAIAVTLHGRADLPKHWALSAALEVGTGAQLSQAMGEWKELADSVSRQSEFAVGDPSGFSFVDLSADRSGFLIAQAAIDDDRAAATAARLHGITMADVLPPGLMTLDEGLSATVFAQRYGTIDDPRFAVVLARIDAALGASIFR